MDTQIQRGGRDVDCVLRILRREGQEKRSRCGLPDRWWRTGPDSGGAANGEASKQLPFSSSLPPPPFFGITAPETLGDFMKTESGPNWERRIHGAGARLSRASSPA